MKKQLYKNMLDRQTKAKKYYSHGRVSPMKNGSTSPQIVINAQDEDKFLSEFAKKKYSRKDYD